MYPDPKEIQNNLSGFLSFKNARIFTGELWQQLLNSKGSINIKKIENPKINDKIKSFPRLGPTENKQNNIVSIQNKSFDKKENRRYRFTGSWSDSFSSRYSRSRSRSFDSYKYRDDKIRRSKTRSRTKSSSRYTPYTRYSRYTDSYEENSSCSSTSHSQYKRSYSSSSSISNDKSEIPTKTVSVNQNDLFLSTDSESIKILPYKKSTPSIKQLEIKSEKSMGGESYLSEIYMNNFKNISPSPKHLSSVNHSQTSSSSSSISIAFVSPGNPHLHEIFNSRSPTTDTSSDYTFEFMDKEEFDQSDHCISDDEFESDVEWITLEEFQTLKSNEFDILYDSSSTNSYSTSEYSPNDIEWIEDHQLDQLSNKYFLI